MNARRVAVIGATGVVGQRFLQRLEGHPWFRLGDVVASDASRGRPYAEAARWALDGEVPESARDLEVRGPGDDLDADLVFSALPSGSAGAVERALASRGHKVFTNAADLRMEDDVPIVVPEVNPGHLALAAARAGERGGFIVANGNCTSVILSLALKPLQDGFGLAACHVVTFQALSGAGYPGVPGLDAVANVIPHIPGEEAKVEAEPRRILGALRDGRIEPASFPVSATCARVPVLEGHLEAVSIRLADEAGETDIVDALRSFRGARGDLRLPSAPRTPVVYRAEADRPQPRLDWAVGDGMSVTVGRLRRDPVLGWKFLVSGSNTIRGAAGGAILTAELAVASGLA